jgi:hypothetical protein
LQTTSTACGFALATDGTFIKTQWVSEVVFDKGVPKFSWKMQKTDVGNMIDLNKLP